MNEHVAGTVRRIRYVWPAARLCLCALLTAYCTGSRPCEVLTQVPQLTQPPVVTATMLVGDTIPWHAEPPGAKR